VVEQSDLWRLGEEIGNVLRGAVHSIAHAQRSLNERFDEQAGRLEVVEAGTADVDRRLAALEEAMTRLDGRLSELLGERTRQRADLATADLAVHNQIAQKFQGFVDHQLQALARERARALRSRRRSEAELVPELIGHLCWVLFGGQAVDAAAAYELLEARPRGADDPVADICSAADALRMEAAATGHPHRWEFSFHAGTQLDPNRQTPWASCSPSRPVHFVVSPAYLVGDRLFSLQRVFTEF
jgi:hypothetical protein